LGCRRLAGSNPATLINLHIGEWCSPVNTPASGAGDFVGSNPTSPTIYYINNMDLKDYVKAPDGHQIQVGDVLVSNSGDTIHIDRVSERHAFIGFDGKKKIGRYWLGMYWTRHPGDTVSGTYYKLYTKTSSVIKSSFWYRVQDRELYISMDTVEVALEKENILVLKGDHYIFKKSDKTACFNNEKEALKHSKLVLQKIIDRETIKFDSYIKRLQKQIQDINTKII
jgi:hypothetical protein